MHELFEETACKTPQAIAVQFGVETLSYGELNDQANQLARYLTKLGVGPEARVGICAERSLELLTGILAILKAGGAYVPLDPGYPAERLEFMLKDGQVNVVLTQEHLAGKFCSSVEQVICLNRDQELWPQRAQKHQLAE